MSFLDGREVETLEKADRLADNYALTHKASPRKPFPHLLVLT